MATTHTWEYGHIAVRFVTGHNSYLGIWAYCGKVCYWPQLIPGEYGHIAVRFVTGYLLLGNMGMLLGTADTCDSFTLCIFNIINCYFMFVI